MSPSSEQTSRLPYWVLLAVSIGALATLFVVARYNAQHDEPTASEAAPAPPEIPSQPTTEPDHDAPLEPVTLTLTTWQGLDYWAEAIEAFEATHPTIEISLRSVDGGDYDADLEQRWEDDVDVADIISCRGNDLPLKYFMAGHFASVSDVDGMHRFRPLQTSTWTTDDGLETFCVPVAGVAHAVVYNVGLLDELGIATPTTQTEFEEALETIAADGRYVPFGIGLETERVATSMIWEVFGADNWGGEEGRFGLISGTSSFTDEGFMSSLEELERMANSVDIDLRTLSRGDGHEEFEDGRAVFMPAGSWEAPFVENLPFDVGVMPAPPAVAGDCFATVHSDFGLAMGATTEHPDEVKAFLSWLSTPEFVEAFFDEDSGFFSLQEDASAPKNLFLNKIANELEDCEPTERLTVHLLSRGDSEDLTAVSGAIVSAVLAGEVSAQEAAEELQTVLEESHGTVSG